MKKCCLIEINGPYVILHGFQVSCPCNLADRDLRYRKVITECCSYKRHLVFIFSSRFNEMLSLLLIRTFLFLTILTTSCTAFLSIKVVKEKDNFQKSSKNGGFDFSHSCSNFSERAVIVNRTLKCVPENDIISTVKATDEMQETYRKWFSICQILEIISNKLSE